MNYEMIRLIDRPGIKEQAAKWFHEKWRIPLEAYEASMDACLKKTDPVPQWYVAVEGSRIIGGMGVKVDFHRLIEGAEYDFLRTNPHLGKRIMVLGPGGSYAYGTDNENSDMDIRGIALNLPSDLLGLTEFEQYEDRGTDMVIYSFNKMVGLLLECNPNTCEILGLDEGEYMILSDQGRELLKNRQLFLSKRAAKSFDGYAGAQLRRLQNAIARDSLPQMEREKHILNSVRNALDDFARRRACGILHVVTVRGGR